MIASDDFLVDLIVRRQHTTGRETQGDNGIYIRRVIIYYCGYLLVLLAGSDAIVYG
jgi:hypothetical protein